MKKVRAAIVGYGNIGHYVFEALQAAPDFEIASSMVRTMESLPGSQPAEMMDTVLCFLASASSVRRKAVIPVWISKLSTV